MSIIKPVSANSSQASPAQPEAPNKSVGQESVEKSSFASTGRHPWRSFVAGDIHETGGSIPSEDLGPLMDELSNMDEFAENGLPGANSALADEAHDDVAAAAAAAAEEQGPEMIRKSEYGKAIDEIQSTLMLGENVVQRGSASELQMPSAPALNDILKNNPQTVENIDGVLSRYDAARKANLALLDSSKKALNTGAVNYFEVQTLQEYVKNLEQNLWFIEQQMEQAQFLRSRHHAVEEQQKIKEQQREDRENGIRPRGPGA